MYSIFIFKITFQVWNILIIHYMFCEQLNDLLSNVTRNGKEE